MNEQDLDILAAKIAGKINAVSVRYMSLKQAAIYSGIGQKQLIKMAEAGKIKGRKIKREKRAGWSFDRESIDKFWHQPWDDINAKARSILDHIRRKA
ncbi:hypothetical protein [uncultured Desulfobacter sp.]|uniref:hypothetical protein n=1 Tax=uncultured Desulfobacter sp. TaxID=240139 RepID=UPI0029F4D537|nr:hypothetical protein [uncultured Desulfobacter sp.]